MRVLCLLLASLALAQSPTGEITGLVRDASGSAVPLAEVTIVNQNTGETRVAFSSETGDYAVPLLPVGEYRLRVRKAGFRAVERQGIVLSALQSLRVDFGLEVGEVTESVTVTAEAPQVDTRTATMGMLVDDRRIRDLPLNGRNAIDLARLVPGVTSVGTTIRPSFGQQTIRMNGGRHTSVNFLLDGGSINYYHRGQGLGLPPPDALQEFKLVTTGVTAEYGRGFGVLSAVTRSGANSFHGSAWEFLRNNFFDARGFFSSGVPKLRFNQFGGTFGGRIRRDKTFFFGSYQGLRIREDQMASSAFPPSEAERRGDFSGQRSVTDPLTRQPFPGNQIPAIRFDPVAAKVRDSYVPLPNRPGGQYVAQVNRPTTGDLFLVRVDHAVTTNNKLNVRYYQDYNRGLDNFPEGTNLPGYSPFENSYRQQTTTAEDTYTFTASLLNVLRLTYTRFNYLEANTVRQSLTDLGGREFVHAGGPVTLPRLIVTGRIQLSPGRDRQRLSDNFDLSENLTWNRGRHQAKWGLDYQHDRFLYRDNRDTGGEFRFDGSQTASAFADFLIGRPLQLNQASPLETQHYYAVWGVFAQDTFKASARLTLSFGLRYEYFPRWKEKRNEMASYVGGARSQFIPNAPVSSVYLPDPQFPYRSDDKNFGPRIGVAWDVSGNGRTSLRAGYGISYDSLTGEMAGGVLLPQPFGLANTLNVPYALSAPYQGLSNPFPFQFDPGNARFVLPVRIPKSFDPGLRNPYAQNYSFSIQRQLLPNLMLDVAYAGNTGRKLIEFREFNPAVYRPGATASNTNQRRRYAPTYASIGQLDAGTNSSYNGLQVQVNKRFSRGLTLTAAYTFSKAIDEVSSGGSAFATVDQHGAQNPDDRKGDRGPGDFDRRHRWVTSYLYELPFFRSKSFAARLLGGWELGGILTLQSGDPFTVTTGRDNSLTGVGYDRPDLIGDPHLPSRSRGESIEGYFNTAAFRENTVGTYGNAGRDILNGPGDAGWDVSVSKTFPLRESHALRFRLDAFNLPNHPNLGDPVSILTVRAFGRITSASAGRILQLSLKYSF
jgi:hypothetical protein